MTNNNADYKYNTRHSPGHGGMKCACCTHGKPSEVKRLINRAFRRQQKKQIKKEGF